MSQEWGEGSPRKVAYDLIDDCLDDLLRDRLHGHVTRNFQAVFEAVVAIKAELADRCRNEEFPWDRVRVGAMFVHTRYVTVSRRPETCKIYKLTYLPDGGIREVFYTVGDGAAPVYTPADKFPAAVRNWVTPNP